LDLPPDFPYAKVVSQNDFANLIRSQITNLSVATINPFSNANSSDSKRFAMLNDLHWSGSFLQSNSTSRLEEGDSGSPLYGRISTGIIVVGVVKGRGSNYYNNWDAYSPVAPLACEISRNLVDQSQAGLLCH
jgi:hypothetical protein